MRFAFGYLSLLFILTLAFSCQKNQNKRNIDSLFKDINNLALNGDTRAMDVLDSLEKDQSLSPVNKAKVFFERGNYYILRSEFSKAIPLLEQAIDLMYTCKSAKCKESISWYHTNIAYAYLGMGKYSEGLEYHQSALKIADTLENESLKSKIYQDIGNIYFVTGAHSESKSYYEKSLNIAMDFKDSVTMGNCYGSLGLIESERGHYDKALELFETSNRIFLELGLERDAIANYNNLAVVSMFSGQFDQTYKFIQKVLDYRIRVKDHEGLIRSYANIAYYYEHLDYKDSAIVYYKKSLDVSKAYKLPMHIKNNHLYLSELYQSMDSTEQAFKHYKISNSYKDSLFSVDKSKALKALEEQYKRDKKLELLKKDQIIQFYLYGSVILFLALFSIGLFLILKKRVRIQAQKLKIKALNEKYLEKELENRNLKQTQLENALAQNKQEILNFSLYLKEKNRSFQLLSEAIEKVKSLSDLSHLKADVKLQLVQDKSFINLHEKIELVNIDFFEKIKNIHPNLNQDELNLIGLLRLNFSSKQVAEILNSTERGIEMKRYRLRKKLNIEKGQSLTEYILKIDNQTLKS